jgi:phosphopantothenate-cysteine ligase/phosphopantothenoylcysteine decarboxylase/phosphopantothenate--cysteine ligase
MKILITTGNTQTPIDQVRCITNIFTGRTGTRIALQAHERGHAVCLLTSHPEVVRELAPNAIFATATWDVRPYRTFEELEGLMAKAVSFDGFEMLIHAAAVSDYYVAGVYAPASGTSFSPQQQAWFAAQGAPRLSDVRAGKVTSRHPELWLRLTPTPKLADRVRSDWGFRGKFVKFKLEVGLSEAQLLKAAEASRRQSGADWMVANTFEGRYEVAYIGTGEGTYQRVERMQLADALLERLAGRD